MESGYRAEYAKTGRASCRACFCSIEKDSLRLAIIMQSQLFDGKIPHWYHFHCFFLVHHPRSIDDISHLQSLRWNDQEAIQCKIEAQQLLSNRNRKRYLGEDLNETVLKDFHLEYSKSNRSICTSCSQKICVKEIKISKKDFKSDMVGSGWIKQRSKQTNWYHVKCFVGVRSKLRYFETADKLPGFDTLKENDRQELIQLMSSDEGKIPVKKEKSVVLSEISDNIARYDQNKLLFSYRDELIQLKKTELELLFETNDQRVPIGRDRMLDRLSDIMAFGALNPCTNCGHGQFVFHNLGYICQGYLTEWTKCNHITKEPKRRPFLVPAKLAEKYSFLDTYTCVPQTRIIRERNYTPGRLFENDIFNHGGKITTKIGSTSMAVLEDVNMEVDIVDAKPVVLGEIFNNKALHDQNKLLFSYHDELIKLTKTELELLFETNEQSIPVGWDRMLDRLSDIMTFGALNPCTNCGDGQFVFQNFRYVCQGYLTEWTKCNQIMKEPKRRPFLVPAELADKYSFLDSYTYVPHTRIIRECTYTPASLLGNDILNNGGKIATKNGRTSTTDIEDVNMVAEGSWKEHAGRVPELSKKNIFGWDFNHDKHLPSASLSLYDTYDIPHTLKRSRSRKPYDNFWPLSLGSGFGDIFRKPRYHNISTKITSGVRVGPNSALNKSTHIYEANGVKYTAMLGLVDIQRQINKYYKLELLESNNKNKYFLFRSWGRTGTTIGGCQKEELSLDNAIRQFYTLYRSKSGNSWENRNCFRKVPGLMYPIDVDCGEVSKQPTGNQMGKVKVKPPLQSVNTNDVSSKLSNPVQELVKLIFDVKHMENVMLEFKINVEKMPLGKLSKAQLQNAYKALNEIQRLLENESSLNALIGASNQFYTFVPHSCGMDALPVIKDFAALKKKVEMVDTLMALELAYNVMTYSVTNGINITDTNYNQLKTEIEVLDQQTEEFKIIEEYVRNTQGVTHKTYNLKISEVFIIKRQGEEERYKRFSQLNNRKLLWHGSRTTNYVGILSHGLCIAPPEVPSSGYMFGKGIYFADMVSKSANYCQSSHGNSGLMLLCEVALGEMVELYKAKYVKKLPNGKHSVKGVGSIEPDPKQFKVLPGDVHVPVGKGIVLPRPAQTTLNYNEYIVYDAAQVNIKYLVRMNFNRNR